MIADMKRELGELAVQSQALSDAYLLEKRNGYLYIGMGQMNIKSLLGLKKGVLAWYYGTYKEPIMFVGESGEKL